MKRKSVVFAVSAVVFLLLLSSCRIADDRLGILSNTKWMCGSAILEFYDTAQGLAKGSLGSESAQFEVSYSGGVLSVRYISGCSDWKGDGSAVSYLVSVDGQTMTTEPKESGRCNAFFTAEERIWNKVN